MSNDPPLGGMEPQTFLSEYWQKKPLLIRDAWPGFEGFMSPAGILRQAANAHTPSRLLYREDGVLQTDEGPLRLHAQKMPEEDWTVLVQGIECVDERAWDILQRFRFIPRARIDDLMVSVAAPGGGVGPHSDRYDVFLLQGLGRRRWRFGSPTQEEILGPGDMLYLPPELPHDGVAIDECTTYSIGFLAPSREAILLEYLGFRSQGLTPAGLYQDANLSVPEQTARIPAHMVEDVTSFLAATLPPKPAEVSLFLGRLLSAPKSHVEFSRPAKRARRDFQLATGTMRLQPASRALFDSDHFFLNGDAIAFDPALTELAENRRQQLPAPLRPETRSALRRWFEAGWITVDKA